MKRTFEDDLTAILVNKNNISQQESIAMRQAFAESDADEFEDFLLQEGIVGEVDLLRALALYYKVPSFDVRGNFFDRFLLKKFPKSFLMRYGIIPLEADNEAMTIVAANPSDPNLPIEVARFVSYDVYFCVGVRKDIAEAIEEFYDKSETDLGLDDGDDIVFEEEKIDLDEFEFFEE